MNRGQLISQIVANLGGRSTTSLLVQIVNNINLGLDEISTRYPWRALHTTPTPPTVTSGDMIFTCDARTVDLVEARVNDQTIIGAIPLEIRPKNFVVQRWPNQALIPPGRPYVCYKEGLEVFLYPPPNRTYTINYTITIPHPALSQDSDSTIIRGIDSAVVDYATSETFMQLHQEDMATSYVTRFEKNLLLAERMDKRLAGMQRQMDPHPGSEKRGYLSGTPWLDPFVEK